ncbi:MAG: hypothetical protein ACKO2P_11380, partial [Planctomycetota bacterium]
MPATDDFRWNQQKLHAVFAASSVVLLLAVYAMLRQDQADEWRTVQRNGFAIDAEMRRSELKKLRSPEYMEELKEVDRQLQAAAEETEAQKQAHAELFKKLSEQERLVESLEVDLKFRNSIRDEASANLDLAVRDSLPEAVMAARKAAFEAQRQRCNERQKDLDAAREVLTSLQAEAKAITAKVDELEVGRTKLLAQADRINSVLENIAPSDKVSAFKRALMEMPIIDGFNSHLKVVQDWLPRLKITLGMSKIARFDRCRSCHQNIDKTTGNGGPAYPPGHPDTEDVVQWVRAGKFPQPYSTHPNTELYCTASSPHPVDSFGCTICHDGQGSGTSFGNAEHTPNDPHIAEQWHHEYGFHPNHFWEYPMQPDRFIESGCIKCHHNVTELGIHPKFGASAPKVYRGDQLLRKYGCYGCHEIHG